jgi:cell division protease FtsH
VFFGRVTTGAADDLRRASELARDFVCRYGMSLLLGPRTTHRGDGGMAMQAVASPPAEALLPFAALEVRADRAVDSLLRDAEACAALCLAGSREAMDSLAKALLQDETVSGEQLRECLSTTSLPRRVEAWLRSGVLAPADADDRAS